MADVYVELMEFSGGCQAAGPGDRIPKNSFSIGRNTAFRNIGTGSLMGPNGMSLGPHPIANVGVRPGLKTVNTTAFSGSPTVIYQQLYSYDNGADFTNYLPTICADGSLRYKYSTNAYGSALVPPANFPTPSATCFAPNDMLVDGTVMDNRLFLVNEHSERRSLVGTVYHAWGLSPYSIWTAASAATGANAMPNETYDLSITTYDTVTGGESSTAAALTVTMGGANRRIKVDITPTTAEIAQFPYWRVYLRRQSTQANQYLVQTLYDAAGTVIVSDGNIPVGTTTVYIDASATVISLLTTTAPTSTENNVPPSAIRFCTVYGRRLLAADRRSIYWSQHDRADSFDPLNTEPIDTGEGDQITGLYPYSDELLLIFTTTAVWGLFGSDPETWTLKPVDHTIGCSGIRSVVEFESKVGWWSAADGPVMYDGTKIHRIGLDKLGRQPLVADIETARLPHITSGNDPQGYRVIWSVPLVGSVLRNSRLFVYNYRLNEFEASYWDPMDIASLSTGYSSDGSQRLFAGGYGGQVFYFDAATFIDGVANDTTFTGTFVPSMSTFTTITDATATFDTTGAGLAERYVVVTDASNRVVAKVRISSNTSTVLTLSSTSPGFTPNATYTYYIGSPDFRFYTKWLDMDQTFIRKRFDRVYLHADAGGDDSDLFLGTQLNFIDENLAAQSVTLTTGELWDAATTLWDYSKWTGTGQVKKRLSILRSAQAIRIGLFHFTPKQDMVVNTIGILARSQSDRYYG